MEGNVNSWFSIYMIDREINIIINMRIYICVYINIYIFSLALTVERVWVQWHCNSNELTVPRSWLLLHTVFYQKEPGQHREMICSRGRSSKLQGNPGTFCFNLKARKYWKNDEDMSQRLRNQFEWTPLGQTKDNLSIKINNERHGS